MSTYSALACLSLKIRADPYSSACQARALLLSDAYETPLYDAWTVYCWRQTQSALCLSNFVAYLKAVACEGDETAFTCIRLLFSAILLSLSCSYSLSPSCVAIWVRDTVTSFLSLRNACS